MSNANKVEYRDLMIYEEERANDEKIILTYAKPDYRVISNEQYERLKRLDENVKAFTLGLKHGLPNLIDKSNEEIVKQIIRELESLDK